jgi:hypothetical protein
MFGCMGGYECIKTFICRDVLGELRVEREHILLRKQVERHACRQSWQAPL